jgi:hypothetical protein
VNNFEYYRFTLNHYTPVISCLLFQYKPNVFFSEASVAYFTWSLYSGHVRAFIYRIGNSLQILNDEGGRTTTAVADTGAANLGALLL